MNSLCLGTLRRPSKFAGFFTYARDRPSLLRPTHARHSTTYLDPAAPYKVKRKILWTVIAANVAVFGSWSYARQKRDLPLLQSLSLNFRLSRQAIREGRYWTIITNTFSHHTLSHILFNMIALYSFSAVLLWQPAVSAMQYLALIVGSGLSGSAAFLEHSWINKDNHRGLGASGIVSGVGVAAAFLDPRAKFLIWGIVPAPLWMLVSAAALLDILLLGASDKVGHSAHIGGALFGAAYYFVSIRARLR